MAFPKVVSREQWLEARLRLLAQEKELTRRRDELNAARRRLPMVAVGKQYTLHGPDGPVTLCGLFGASTQLIVYHVMFGPDWDAACPVCTAFIDALSDALLDRLRARDTAFVLVSRAPLAKIWEYRYNRGWTLPWYSSHGSDFNYDFGVSLDRSVPQLTYNYRPEPQLADGARSCELPGFSCFLRSDGAVYHTYSTYARGADHLDQGYALLDLTALGRQEEWEQPRGRAPVLHG